MTTKVLLFAWAVLYVGIYSLDLNQTIVIHEQYPSDFTRLLVTRSEIMLGMFQIPLLAVLGLLLFFRLSPRHTKLVRLSLLLITAGNFVFVELRRWTNGFKDPDVNYSIGRLLKSIVAKEPIQCFHLLSGWLLLVVVMVYCLKNRSQRNKGIEQPTQ